MVLAHFAGAMKTPTVRLASREELLGFVPYALGFHPTDSLVLLGLGRKHVELAARADANWATRDHIRQFTKALRGVKGVSRVFLFGYGPESVEGPVKTVAAGLQAFGYLVMETLRVTGDRFHCLQCDGCTPADGRPFDVSTSAAAATAIFAGMVARPDRAAVDKLIRPIGGLAAIAMSQAVDRAEKRLDELGGRLREAGIAAVEDAFGRAKTGERLDDDEVAWLSLVLHDGEVRDHAWKHSDREDWQFALWLDLTRRAEPLLAAPVASLLGWCAWRQGDGALAMAAILRALRIDPGYRMGLLIRDALDQGRPPHTIKKWPVGFSAWT